jgi:hypothetical protein
MNNGAQVMRRAVSIPQLGVDYEPIDLLWANAPLESHALYVTCRVSKRAPYSFPGFIREIFLNFPLENHIRYDQSALGAEHYTISLEISGTHLQRLIAQRMLERLGSHDVLHQT